MEKNYWNPYFGGVVLGTMLFLTFAIAAQGFGASGTFSRATAQLLIESDKSWLGNSYVASYFRHSLNALDNWTVMETLGILLGGFVSALLAGRLMAQDEVDALVGQAVDTLRPSAVHQPAVEGDAFATPARRGEEGTDELQPAHIATGLLPGLADGHGLEGFPLLHVTPHRLQQPGRFLVAQRTDAELLDEHHRILDGIVEQHGNGMVALHPLAHQFRAPATRETFVLQAVTMEFEKATPDLFGLQNPVLHFRRTPVSVSLNQRSPPGGGLRFYPFNRVYLLMDW